MPTRLNGSPSSESEAMNPKMKGHTRSILIVAEWVDPRFQRGVARYVKQAGWHLNLDSVYNHVLPHGWQGDGCIAIAGTPEYASFTQSLGVPVVGVTGNTAAPFAGIREDDDAIGRLAADYFLGLGFQHYACYGLAPLPISTARSASYSRRLAAAGFEPYAIPWELDRTGKKRIWSHRMARLAQKLEALPKPIAIFCVDDCMAVDIIETCMQCELRIPDDVSVLGVGNLEMACECSVIPISSIRIDFERYGFQAAELLGQILDGAAAPAEPILIPPSGIEERRSTYTMAVEDPAGRRAMRFMLDHFSSPINTGDVAAAARISRRYLTTLMRKELGKPPAELLEDIRIRKACELLKTSDYPIKRVAYDTGLGTALRLQRIFRKRFNMAPSQWRAENSTG